MTIHFDTRRASNSVRSAMAHLLRRLATSLAPQQRRGSIELIVGGMFAGKTSEAIGRAIRATFARKKITAFKHVNDSGRYDPVQLASHDGKRLMANVVDDVATMETVVLAEDPDIIIIDEAQFFDMDLLRFARKQRRAGRRVIIVGLNMDFKGNPFPGPVPSLLAVADKVHVPRAICTVCGEEAGFSERLTDSKDTVRIGAKEEYAARCILHWSGDRNL